MNRSYQLLPLLLLPACELSLSLDDKASCASDGDCLGDRICVENTCTDPDADGDGTPSDDGDPADGDWNGPTPTDAGEALDAGAGWLDGSAEIDGAPEPGPVCSVDCALGDRCSVDANCAEGTCEEGLCVTVLPNVIEGDVVLRAEDSPYWLSADTQAGGELRIEAGVRLIGTDHHLRVFGSLLVRGTAENRVKLERVWVDTSSDEYEPSVLDIEFAHFESGGVYTTTGYGNLRLVDSLMEATELMYLWYPVSDCVLARNVFFNGAGMSVGVGYHSEDIQVEVINNYFDVSNLPPVDPERRGVLTLWADSYGSSLIVRHNTFVNTDGVAVALALSAGDLFATENYWSTSDLGTIQRMIYDRHDDLSLAAKIAYEPYLTAPHPLTPTPNTPAHAWPQPELASDAGVEADGE